MHGSRLSLYCILEQGFQYKAHSLSLLCKAQMSPGTRRRACSVLAATWLRGCGDCADPCAHVGSGA
jgi:hypothetical protein